MLEAASRCKFPCKFPAKTQIPPSVTMQTDRQRTRPRLLGFLLLAIIGFLNPVHGEDTPQANSPVRVYIMLGQSNMLGFGKVAPKETPGTLEFLVQQKGKYSDLVDDSHRWIPRDDARYIHVMQQRGQMRTMRNEWLVPNKSFGPELGFGQVVADAHEQPVLLLKACIGNRSLGWDLLPPGSESFEFEGKIYAGYKQSPLSWDKGTTPEPINWYAGKQYDDDVANAKRVLENLAEFVPEFNGRDIQVCGFVWWQGHKDQNAAHASRYEQNLVHLIKSLRNDFDAPDAKFVIATIAFDGQDLSGHGLEVAKAQLAVSGETGNYLEFADNVKAIDARPFWRPAEQSPNARQGYHYFHNAETYMEVGLALGRAMLALEQPPQ